MKPSVIFFATANAHKLEEIEAILGNEIELQSFKNMDTIPEVSETENTLEGNAELKARAYYKITNLPCFADDTGLEVEALNGAPGVYSARYAGEACKAEDNMKKLLEALANTSNRRAQFRTVIAWFDGTDLKLFEGILKGKIATEKRGSHGFGYDPLFIPEGYSNTLAELGLAEKNRISHRAKAVTFFIQFLKNG